MIQDLFLSISSPWISSQFSVGWRNSVYLSGLQWELSDGWNEACQLHWVLTLLVAVLKSLVGNIRVEGFTLAHASRMASLCSLGHAFGQNVLVARACARGHLFISWMAREWRDRKLPGITSPQHLASVIYFLPPGLTPEFLQSPQIASVSGKQGWKYNLWGSCHIETVSPTTAIVSSFAPSLPFFSHLILCVVIQYLFLCLHRRKVVFAFRRHYILWFVHSPALPTVPFLDACISLG